MERKHSLVHAEVVVRLIRAPPRVVHEVRSFNGKIYNFIYDYIFIGGIQ